MKKILSLLLTLSSVVAFAKNASTKGAEIPSEQTHVVSVGTSGIEYQRWNGSENWGFSGEFLYGQWQGNIDNGLGYDWGFAINAMKRFDLDVSPSIESAFEIKPGLAYGGIDVIGTNISLFQFKVEAAVPMTYQLNNEFNLLTGGSVPFTYNKIEDFDGSLSLPFYGRLGIEMLSLTEATPFALLELGPMINIPFADGADTQVDFAFRLTAGASF